MIIRPSTIAKQRLWEAAPPKLGVDVRDRAAELSLGMVLGQRGSFLPPGRRTLPIGFGVPTRWRSGSRFRRASDAIAAPLGAAFGHAQRLSSHGARPDAGRAVGTVRDRPDWPSSARRSMTALNLRYRNSVALQWTE
jgi:hypothetical protein